MKSSTSYVGLDVHKSTISVAIAEDGRGGDVRDYGVVENRADILVKLVGRLGRHGQRLHFCYEAGPCGYGLHRLLSGLGQDCTVVAPSLIPKKAGDRVKTNRRDAAMLARLHRAGELTAVWVPDAAHEAMRDLVRARATAARVLGKARQHLSRVPVAPWPDLWRPACLDGGLPALANNCALRPSRSADRPAGLHPRR